MFIKTGVGSFSSCLEFCNAADEHIAHLDGTRHNVKMNSLCCLPYILIVFLLEIANKESLWQG